MQLYAYTLDLVTVVKSPELDDRPVKFHLTLTSIIQLHMYNRIAIQLQNIKSQTC